MEVLTSATKSNIDIFGLTINCPSDNRSWGGDFTEKSAFFESDTLYRTKSTVKLYSSDVDANDRYMYYPAYKTFCCYVVEMFYLPQDEDGNFLPYVVSTHQTSLDDCLAVSYEILVFGKAAKRYQTSNGDITDLNGESGLAVNIKYACTYDR